MAMRRWFRWLLLPALGVALLAGALVLWLDDAGELEIRRPDQIRKRGGL